MFTRLKLLLVVLSFFSITSFGQQTSSPSASAAAQEFPVTFQESIVAGKTPAGTKVQAKLRMATLVNGAVIPQGAVFSGEVLESVAKTKSDPSKLGIRIDAAQWKNGSASLKLYLIGWFYPFTSQPGQDLQYGPQQSAKGTWNGMGEYPSDNTKSYHPFPAAGSDSNSSPDTSNSRTSQHRVQMKNVQTDRSADGAIMLVSTHSNIKLDKTTTYVVANAELLAASPKSAAAK